MLLNPWRLWPSVWLLVRGVRRLCRPRVPTREAVGVGEAEETVDGWKALQRHEDDDDGGGGRIPKLPTVVGVRAHANSSSRPICCG